MTHNEIIKIILITALLMVITSIILLSSVPPVSRDVLIHHLAIPKLYIKNGGIYEIPGLSYSYYPMNLNLIYMIPLFFKNDIIPKFIHFIFGLLTAYILYDFLKKHINTVFGIMGALFFLTIPVIVKLSITAYVDLGLIFFSTFTFFILLKWSKDTKKYKHMILAALGCGIGMGVKYNGLIMWFLFSLLVPILYVHSHNDRKAINNNIRWIFNWIQIKGMFWGVCFSLLAVLVFSPWMVRNYVWTKNPLYPLYMGLFNPDRRAVLPEHDDDIIESSGEGIKAISGNHFILRKAYFKEPLWKIVLIPVRIFFQGKDDSARYFDGKLTPFLFLLPFFSIINSKNRTWQFELNCLSYFSIFYILITFFQTDMRIRYIGPAIPALVIAVMAGLYEVVKFIKKKFTALRHFFISLLIAVLFAGNIKYIAEQFQYIKPLEYISGKISREGYIEKYRPEYGVIRYANIHIPKDSKILCLFMGKRGYYSDHELVFDWEILSNRFRYVTNEEQITLDLQNMGIKYIILRHDLLKSLIKNELKGEKQKFAMHFITDRLTLMTAKGGYGLYSMNRIITH